MIKIFGDAGDVATKNDNARNMVVVKVKGNVTIEEGVTVDHIMMNYMEDQKIYNVCNWEV